MVQNELSEPILLCWIAPSGELMGHRRISEQAGANTHTEDTHTGHSFVCVRYASPPPVRLVDVDALAFLAHYTPRTHAKHVLTIRANQWGGVLPTVSTASLEVVDSSSKVYETICIGGFTVHCEPGVFACSPSLEELLTTDIEAMSAILPQTAKERLQASTPIWLNKSLVYGPVAAPIDEQRSMYHSQKELIGLRKKGLNVAKAGGVEICNALYYLQSRTLWGPGGLLLHEFSHAFHDKCCPDGSDCADIIQAYQLAMSRGLYDAVDVHGPEGLRGPIKHYACTNPSEFFAELSVAYHWKEQSEHNKWFPFNHQQLLQRDPDTCRVLDKLWLV